MKASWLAAALGASLALGACDSDETEPTYLSREALMNPETCAECHPKQYEEWSGSMHAYASEDPVFVAMNARGQRETDGALGSFCVDCHAPLAVAEGLTTDGLNLDEVPAHMKGITCFYCHTVEAVEGTHNNPLKLADDTVMRGGFADPVANTAHASAYSTLHDRNSLESAKLCGACHDVVLDSGVELERTFIEWKDSLFSKEESGQPLSCGSCHMRGTDDTVADYEGVKLRRRHSHMMPGVDVAITEFPQREAQRAAVQAELNTTVLPELCVYDKGDEGADVLVSLENIAAGHSFPSGAAHDRRVWVQLQAWVGDSLIYETGNLEEGRPLVELEAEDPDLWRFGDRAFKPDGTTAHMFWDVDRVESNLLRAPAARSPLEPGWFDNHETRTFQTPALPDRIVLQMHIRPIGLDVLDDLIATGDLDPVHRDAMPTFTLENARLEWDASLGRQCIP